MRYAVLGIGEDFSLRRLTFYNPMVSTQSEDCDDLKPKSEYTFDSLTEAADLADRLLQMDQMYWPPFDPVIAEVEDGKATKLLSPGELEGGIAKAAARHGLDAVVIEPV